MAITTKVLKTIEKGNSKVVLEILKEAYKDYLYGDIEAEAVGKRIIELLYDIVVKGEE